MKNILSICMFALTIMLVFSVSTVHAHKGHAGKIVYVLKSKQALKVLLPKGSKQFKQQAALSESERRWVRQQYELELDTTLKTYYLARDKASGDLVGGAIILTFAYRHGDATIAIGLDNNRQVSGAALLSISDKYLIDFEGTVGKGLLDGFTGSNVQDLADMAAEKSEAVKPIQMAYKKLFEAAATLEAFIRTSE